MKKKKRKWTAGFESPREAVKARIDLLYEVQNNNYIDPSKMTVEVFLKLWIEDYVKKKLAPNSQTTYKTAIEKHIIPEIGNIKLQKLQPSDIDEYYDRKRQKDGCLDGKGSLSEKTLLYHHRILTRAFNYAIYKKRPPLLKENPAGRMADAPKPEKKIINTYEPEDCIRLVEASICDRLEIPINMCLASDFRRGEAIGALWRCLNMETGVPLPVISKGLGHDNPGFTGRQYHDTLMKTGRQMLADNKQRVIYDKVKK